MMKLLAFALASSALGVGGSAAAAEWRLITADSNGVYALDQSGVRQDGSLKTGWFIIGHPQPHNGEDYFLVRYEAACADGTLTRVSMLGYTAEGTATTTSHKRGEPESAPPDSVAEKLLDGICNQAFLNDDVWASPSGLVADYRGALNPRPGSSASAR